ncbi:MAG: hypothetical protein KID00_02935 [Clostridium argentinense]|uniref:Uncharacterized protein n=1 Tax=Clostridium faecium TaxID=2762223 RepID=A0ABR8YXB3_9CLOT|nr:MULTISPECIES: hypothetical protein [Clostridium]MBD8048865.1 hypothetical protein [Clostridium faecium]MBS5822809.1 hypothetical protein [Clostridium argentinense]MDU1349677.1 hypothetical protein [Clostridium argentinense]
MSSLGKLFNNKSYDLKECEQCGKLCSWKDLCKIDGSFGKFIVVCPQCSADMDSSVYMCFNDSDDINYDKIDFDLYD